MAPGDLVEDTNLPSRVTSSSPSLSTTSFAGLGALLEQHRAGLKPFELEPGGRVGHAVGPYLRRAKILSNITRSSRSLPAGACRRGARWSLQPHREEAGDLPGDGRVGVEKGVRIGDGVDFGAHAAAARWRYALRSSRTLISPTIAPASPMLRDERAIATISRSPDFST